MKLKPVTGVILAGGGNRRMGGRLKALLSINGELIIDRQLAEMSRLCEEIVIITNEPAQLESRLAWPRARVRLVGDRLPGKGPLAGLQAAMDASAYEELWVTACDMPCISAEAAAALLKLRRSRGEQGYDAAVPLLNGRLQPLHAIYHKRCGRIVDELLAADQYRMMGLLERLDVGNATDAFFIERGIGLDFAENVNTPEEYNKLNQSLN